MSLTTTNEKGLAATNDQTQGTTNTGIVDDAGKEPTHKAFTRMQAQAAFAGISVYELAGGAYLASRWNWPPRELPDLGALANFLRQQGVQA